jgi:hypothetical protein
MFSHPGLQCKQNADQVPIATRTPRLIVKAVRRETIVPIPACPYSPSARQELRPAGAQFLVQTVLLGRLPVKRGHLHAAPVVPIFTP